MKLLARLLVVLSVVTLTAGPLFAAPVSLTAGTHLTAPHGPAGSLASKALTALGYGLAVFGTIKVKDAAAITTKYVTRAGAAAGDYKTGVANAGNDWETNAKASEGNYEQGVQEAIGRKAFGKGVTGSAGKYQANAVNLGATRYPGGVQNGATAYTNGVAPYLAKIASLNLPPKGPRRSPQNMQRANMVATELGKLKTGQ